MNLKQDAPENIRLAAAVRIRNTLPQQKTTFEFISSKRRTMDAEEDTSRKIAYIGRAVGVPEYVAAAIADYQDPDTLPLTPEKKSRAERLQGPTVDFLSVSFLDLARAASHCICRVVDSGENAIGTGIMVSPGLLLTNNHVVPDKATAGLLSAQFDYEKDYRSNAVPTTVFDLDPGSFYYTTPINDLDFSLIAIGQRKSGQKELAEFGYVPLLDRDDKHMKTIFLNCIQHPAGEHKQVVIRENRLLASTLTTLIYGSDTLPGSSGSGVFNDQWELVALHHWGEPYRAIVDQPQGLPENGNEGIRISAIVKHLRTVKNFTNAEQSMVNQAVEPQFRTPSLVVQRSAIAGILSNPARAEHIAEPSSKTDQTIIMENKKEPVQITANTNDPFSFTVPLTISVRLGKPVAFQQQKELAPHTESDLPEAIKKFVPDPNYKNRKGYDKNFLSKVVNLPRLSHAQKKIAAKNQQAKPGDDLYELKYQHFSVVMNAERRLPFFTAVNIDGSSVITIKRETGEVTRGPESLEGAEGGREKWYNDPRIDEDQISEDEIYKSTPMKDFQRGHLVKRTDPSWGTELRAFKGQSDTFHFSNCSPQHKLFNPKTTRWAGVENWITKTSNDEDIRISVFSGCIFSDEDPKIDYLRIPKAFWKVLAWEEDGSFKTTAILADQSDLITEIGQPESTGLFTTAPDKLPSDYQVSLKKIEELTDLDFGELVDFDIHPGEDGGESIASTVRKIKRFSDIKRH